MTHPLGNLLHTGKLESLAYKILLTISGLFVALLSTLGLTSFLTGKLAPRGALDDESPWDHMGDDATNLRAVHGKSSST